MGGSEKKEENENIPANKAFVSAAATTTAAEKTSHDVKLSLV